MGRGRCTFKLVDLTRAIKAVKKAGAYVAAEVARDGKIVLVLQKDDEPLSTSDVRGDEVNGED